jgi:hypothetical protein
VIVILVTLLTAYESMSAVSTSISDIFGFYTVSPGYYPAATSLQCMFSALRATALLTCRKEGDTSANEDEEEYSKNKIE